jgi:hypothetical protein
MTIIDTISGAEYTGQIECADPMGRYIIRTGDGRVYSWHWGDPAVDIIREPYARYHPLS